MVKKKKTPVEKTDAPETPDGQKKGLSAPVQVEAKIPSPLDFGDVSMPESAPYETGAETDYDFSSHFSNDPLELDPKKAGQQTPSSQLFTAADSVQSAPAESPLGGLDQEIDFIRTMKLLAQNAKQSKKKQAQPAAKSKGAGKSTIAGLTRASELSEPDSDGDIGMIGGMQTTSSEDDFQPSAASDEPATRVDLNKANFDFLDDYGDDRPGSDEPSMLGILEDASMSGGDFFNGGKTSAPLPPEPAAGPKLTLGKRYQETNENPVSSVRQSYERNENEENREQTRTRPPTGQHGRPPTGRHSTAELKTTKEIASQIRGRRFFRRLALRVLPQAILLVLAIALGQIFVDSVLLQGTWKGQITGEKDKAIDFTVTFHRIGNTVEGDMVFVVPKGASMTKVKNNSMIPKVLVQIISEERAKTFGTFSKSDLDLTLSPPMTLVEEKFLVKQLKDIQDAKKKNPDAKDIELPKVKGPTITLKGMFSSLDSIKGEVANSFDSEGEFAMSRVDSPLDTLVKTLKLKEIFNYITEKT